MVALTWLATATSTSVPSWLPIAGGSGVAGAIVYLVTRLVSTQNRVLTGQVEPLTNENQRLRSELDSCDRRRRQAERNASRALVALIRSGQDRPSGWEGNGD